MRIVRGYSDVGPEDRGACAAIGNFDGVHLGHRSVIEQARAAARETGAPLGVVTFDPHPRSFFAPQAPAFRLMNAEAKEHRLSQIGVERLFVLPFDAGLAGLEAEAFAAQVLAAGLGLRHVVVGADFCFGKGRSGSAQDLARFGPEIGFETTIAPLLSINTEAGPVSSTRIRQALSDGHPRDARAMLGHWHRIEGPVIHGEKRGRTLGYPTANLSLAGLHLPRFGVYAVTAEVLTGRHVGIYSGVASLGVRPMFGENLPNLETHLFDFSGDLYGAHLSVGLVEFLRPEQRFDGVEGLIAQMTQDSARARDSLAAL
ncbi:MAG: bifunctional riboflavin kinase/FAD synthetase [Rhodobacteraceae bacterium]|nr:bifunctional riboflavin kinase/FAD synthetase [Paracoccaceae bacterium]